jgi:predicted RNase H-like HicB family nuclease
MSDCRLRRTEHLFRRLKSWVTTQPTGYHINIFASDEDGGYIADIPDLADCSAFGASPKEALAQVLIAREAWLSVARAEGRPIPPPCYRPAIYQVA